MPCLNYPHALCRYWGCGVIGECHQALSVSAPPSRPSWHSSPSPSSPIPSVSSVTGCLGTVLWARPGLGAAPPGSLRLQPPFPQVSPGGLWGR